MIILEDELNNNDNTNKLQPVNRWSESNYLVCF